jgi:hypothetical protein
LSGVLVVVNGLGETWGVIFLGDGARASNNIVSWEGTDVEGRGGSCATKATGSTQASTSSSAARDGGVREVVDATSLVRCLGMTTKKRAGAKRWTEMASWELESVEMV